MRASVFAKPVLIAGGGIGGLTTALCLARKGIQALVFERQEAFAELGAGIQISPNASRVLHHLGLEQGLGDCASLPEGTEFRSWRSGRLVSRSDLGAAATAAYGFPYYHIHRGDLLRLLASAAEQANDIALHTDAELTGFETEADGVCTTVAGEGGEETSHDGAALIGADGIHSTVRERLFGPSSPAFTGNVAWRALVPSERLPAGLVRPVATVWWGPRRHFVHYYVSRGALVNCVCVVEVGRESGWEVESWTERGELAELQADFAGWHEDVRTLIERMDADSLHKWALFDRPPSPQWGKGLVALLGDACHPMLPFMAQGAATAIEDAAVLASCLAAADDVATAIERYAALRQQRAAWIQGLARRNARIFHLSGLAAWARNRAAKRGGKRIMDAVYGYDALAAGSRGSVTPKQATIRAADSDHFHIRSRKRHE